MVGSGFLLALMAAIGCGGDDGSSRADAGALPDAGELSGADAGLSPPAPPDRAPDPAARPAFAPCPAGWTLSTDEDGLSFCDPGASAPGDCGPGRMRLPGAESCVDVGSSCPSGGWPADLPTDAAVVYVRAGATGGDGSRSRPFGTVGEGLAARTPGAIVAIATGEYPERVAVDGSSATLWGACASGTRITGGSETMGAVVFAQAPLVLRDVTLGPSGAAGLWALAEVELHDVFVDRVRAHAVLAQGARVTIDRSLLADTEPDDSGGNGRGADAVRGATLVVRDSEVRGMHEVGIAGFHAGTSVEVSGSRVRDARASAADGALGHAIALMEGATGTLERVAIERSLTQAVLVDGAGSAVVATHVSIVDTRVEASSGGHGTGIAVLDGARAELHAVSVHRSDGAGLVCANGGSVTATGIHVQSVLGLADDGSVGIYLGGCTSVLEGVAVVDASGPALYAARPATVVTMRDVFVRGGSQTAAGMMFVDGASADALRVELLDTAGYAFGVVDPDTSVVLGDVRVAGVRESEEGIGGVGLAAYEGGHADVRVGLFSEHAEGGIVVDGASVDLEDVVVRDGRGLSSLGYGRGVSAQLGASIGGRRLLIEGNRDMGIFVAGAGARAVLEDLVVRDNGGRGANVQDAATLSLARASFARNVDIGLLSLGVGSAIEGSDVSVSGTLALPCDAPPCLSGGTAASAVDRAVMRLERFALDGAPLCGVQIARDAEVDLAVGAVTNNLIGACVQVPGYDLARLMDRVRYEGNGAALDSRDLPIPEPVTP